MPERDIDLSKFEANSGRAVVEKTPTKASKAVKNRKAPADRATIAGRREVELCRLAVGGSIKYFAIHPVFRLKSGEMYMADFIVVHGMDVEVEDCRGFDTPQLRKIRKELQTEFGIMVKVIR